MTYKVVFHCNLNAEIPFHQGLTNITNLLLAIPGEEYEIIMLFNGPAVGMLSKDDCLPFLPGVKKLHHQSVRFLACAHALNKFKVERDDLIEECEVIPEGIVTLIELQNKGFAYIKP